MKDRFGNDWSQIQGSEFWARPVFGRRLFFKHLFAAVSGYFLLPFSRSAEVVARANVKPIGTARNCIFILLAGGPSHVDTFDLKEGPWTPSDFEPTSFGEIRFPRGLMPAVADQLEHIAIVRSVRSWAAVHALAQVWVQIGRNPTAATGKIAPHIGSVVALELASQDPNQVLPPFVALNPQRNMPGAGYFPPEYAPFQVETSFEGLPNTRHPLGQERFERRRKLLLALDEPDRVDASLGDAAAEVTTFHESAYRLMHNEQVDSIFRLDEGERERYGGTPFGDACLTARNILRANLGTRFIQITLQGWDHHADIYGPQGDIYSRAIEFDRGFGSLLQDLKQEGLLEETLVVVLGEFGRTVGSLNARQGRDHYLQHAVVFAGAKIKGGRTIGATDPLGRVTVEPGWHRNRDVRPEDIEATIYSALGIDWTTVRYDDPLGRGFEYVPFADRDLYGPIHELWETLPEAS